MSGARLVGRDEAEESRGELHLPSFGRGLIDARLERRSKKRAARTPLREFGPPSALATPESGNSLPRSSSRGDRLTEALRCSLGSSGFDPQTVRGPSGSPMRALQVWLNRGSTSCTARRGAAATWAKHAIGSAAPSRGDQLST
jgi:hypothetical protein